MGSSDPQTILDAIKSTYGASSFTTRHNALQALLVIKQESSEFAAGFIARAREAMRFLQSTRPPSAPIPTLVLGAAPLYSLEDSDREILMSVLLNGSHYSTLTTSLLAQRELTVQQVEDALKNEEAHQVGAAAAAAVTASSPGSHTAAPATPGHPCHFCGKGGHPVERCFKYEEYSKRAKEDIAKDANLARNGGETSPGVRQTLHKSPKPQNRQERQVFVPLPPPAPSLTPGMQTQGPLLCCSGSMEL